MREQKYFSRFRAPRVATPNLAQAQLDSFKWVLEHGIKETFKEFTPIKDYSGKKFDLEFVKIELGYIAAAFVLFRLFDIWKPPGVRYFDRNHLNSWGVMIDDVVAGLYASLLIGIYRWWIA